MYCENRVPGQFDESSNIHALFDIYCRRFGFLEDVLNDMLTQRDLESAVGENLENIGVIIGRDRPNEFDYSNFFTLEFGGGLGLSDVSQVTGGELAGLSTIVPFTPVDDDAYRSAIKATIITNHSSATGEDLLLYALNTTGVEATFTDGVGIVELRLGLNLNQQPFNEFVNLAPRPSGVKLIVKNKDQL